MSPSFPPVPDEPFGSRDEHAARAAVVAIAQWRAAFATWLASAARDDSISEPLATVLLELLGAAATSGFARYPYRLARFPDEASDPFTSLHAILLWRAGVVDFLSDVWDTMGEADFGIEECQRASMLLTPLARGEGRLCPLCLGEQGDRHFDTCAVQRAWRGDAAIAT